MRWAEDCIKRDPDSKRMACSCFVGAASMLAWARDGKRFDITHDPTLKGDVQASTVFSDLVNISDKYSRGLTANIVEAYLQDVPKYMLRK